VVLLLWKNGVVLSFTAIVLGTVVRYGEKLGCCRSSRDRMAGDVQQNKFILEKVRIYYLEILKRRK
jgi:hypothetical protein